MPVVSSLPYLLAKPLLYTKLGMVSAKGASTGEGGEDRRGPRRLRVPPRGLGLDSFCLLQRKSAIGYAHREEIREPLEWWSWLLGGSVLNAAMSP